MALGGILGAGSELHFILVSTAHRESYKGRDDLERARGCSFLVDAQWGHGRLWTFPLPWPPLHMHCDNLICGLCKPARWV